MWGLRGGGGLFKKMNVQHRTSNPDKIGTEWEKMKKQTYDMEERLFKEKMNVQHQTSNPDKIGTE